MNNGVFMMEHEIKSIDYESDGNEELQLEVQIVESLIETECATSRADSTLEITIIRPALNLQKHHINRKNADRNIGKTNYILEDSKSQQEKTIGNINEKFYTDMDDAEFQQLVKEQHRQIASTIERLEKRMTQRSYSQKFTKFPTNNFSYYIYLDKPENDGSDTFVSQSVSADHNLFQTPGSEIYEKNLHYTTYSENGQIPKVGVFFINEKSESQLKSQESSESEKDHEECSEIFYTIINPRTASTSSSGTLFPDNYSTNVNVGIMELDHTGSSNSQSSGVKIPISHSPEDFKNHKTIQIEKSSETSTYTETIDSHLHPNYLQPYIFNSPKYNSNISPNEGIFGADESHIDGTSNSFTCPKKERNNLNQEYPKLFQTNLQNVNKQLQASSWSKPFNGSSENKFTQPILLRLYINNKLCTRYNNQGQNVNFQSPEQYFIIENKETEDSTFSQNKMILQPIKQETSTSKLLHSLSSEISGIEKVNLNNKITNHNLRKPTTLREQNYCGLLCDHTLNGQNSTYKFHQRFDSNGRKKRDPSTNISEHYRCNKKEKKKHTMDKTKIPGNQLRPRNDINTLAEETKFQKGKIKCVEKIILWDGNNLTECMNSKRNMDLLQKQISTEKFHEKTQCKLESFQEKEKLCNQDSITTATFTSLSEAGILSFKSRSSSHINPQLKKHCAISDPINAISNDEVHALKRKIGLEKEGLKHIFWKKLKRKKKPHNKA